MRIERCWTVIAARRRKYATKVNDSHVDHVNIPRFKAFRRLLLRMRPKSVLIAVISFQVMNTSATLCIRPAIAQEATTVRQGGNYEGYDFEKWYFSHPTDHDGGLSLKGTNFRRANLFNIRAHRVDFTGSNFAEADLRHSEFSDSDLTNANLRNAKLMNAQLPLQILFGANFAGADLRASYLGSADLRSASFRGSDLRGANASGADLRNADLSNASLNFTWLGQADLRGVRGLNQSKLNTACGDRKTELDRGLSIPMCDRVEWFEEIHLSPGKCDPRYPQNKMYDFCY